ncbi:MAG TPA: 2-oxoacid:ferredoxin oxidoreductase subunit gamma, partial [Firmicutes bacterium]|nr:2-oxoacid:ferredoxin oxidoreductase subunit gamma [Bacillota bacterium]
MGNNKIEIRIAGKGGQGILTAGYILGKAIALFGDKNVAQTQSYGPEARGGASRTDLIISKSQIFYTKVRKADYLVVLSQEAYDKYIGSFP